MTRELWLEKATDQLRADLFKRHGYVVPPVRVSVGFPGGRANARKAIGQHWHPRASADGVSQVFVSPVLSDPIQVLDVLVHELVHAIVPEAGHGTPFRAIAVKVGLTGKMTATVAGPELKSELQRLNASLGEFPHAQLNLQDRKKQSTRLLKAECQDCGYTCRVTRKWIEEAGAPLCPCNSEQMGVA